MLLQPLKALRLKRRRPLAVRWLSQVRSKEVLDPLFADVACRRRLIQGQVNAPDGERSDWLLLLALEAEAARGGAGPVLLVHSLMAARGLGGAEAAAGGAVGAGSQQQQQQLQRPGGGKKGGGKGRPLPQPQPQQQQQQPAATPGGADGPCLISYQLLSRLLRSGGLDPSARGTVGRLADCTLLHVCGAAGRTDHLKARGPGAAQHAAELSISVILRGAAASAAVCTGPVNTVLFSDSPSTQVLLAAEAAGDAAGEEARPSMAQDAAGSTPLHLAAAGTSEAHLECARLLAAAAPRSLRLDNKARLLSQQGPTLLELAQRLCLLLRRLGLSALQRATDEMRPLRC